jgi:nucleotide-binding universal stress UspA family protein
LLLMRAKKILFATDFSRFSEAALQSASVLAAESGALLLIVFVDDLPETYVPGFEAGYGGFGYVPQTDHERSKVRDELHGVKPTIPGVQYEHRYLMGRPADEILRLSEDEKVDMIVIGSHGRTGLARVLLGSVAEAVVRRAKCPVLTVKQPTDETEAVSTE